MAPYNETYSEYNLNTNQNAQSPLDYDTSFMPTSYFRTRFTRCFGSSARRHNQLPKSPFQAFVDVLKDGCARIGGLLRMLSSSRETWSNSRTRKLRKTPRMNASGCPCPPIHYSKPDSIGLSLQLASSIEENPKLRAAAEELRKPVSRSEMPCRGLLNLWKSQRLCVLCVLLNDFRRSRHHSHITCA